jgi:predicted kinase
MNELELYVDSLDPSLSNEEKVRLVKEWKKANKWGEQEVEVSETVELEEVDLGAVKKKDGVPGAVAPSMGPQQAPKPVTEFGLEDTFSVSPEPEITYNIDGKDVSKDEWKSYLDKEEKKREAAEMDWLDRLGLSFELGSIDLGKMAASIPETLYDIASIPQNLAADPDSYPIALRPYMKALKAKGYLDFETSSKSFKEEEGLSNPILDYYEEEAKKLQNVVDIYDNENYDSKSIYENFKKGSYSDGFKLLAQGITRSAPVSLSMMAGGAVTTTGKLAAGSTVGFAGPEISKELTSKPGQSELLSIINGLGMGAAEAIWESVGTSTLGKVYKDIISKEGLEAGNKIFKEGLIDMYRTALVKYGAPVAMVEGGVQEVGTKITQNMIKGLPTFEGVNDAFIQGVGGSGLYSSPVNIVKSRAAIKQGITNNKINKELKQTDFDKASQAFNPEFPTTGFEIKASQIPGSLEVIDAEVDVDLSKGDITQEQANGIKLRAREVQGATNQLKPLGISIENQPAIVDLMIEQKNLKNTIKQVDNTSLTKAESSRLTEIDTELGALITKDKAAKIDVGAKKIAEQIGVGFESFETQEDVDSAIATLQEEGGEIDTKNSDNYGTFVTLPGDRSIIILNKETATEDNQFAVGEHETGHAVVYETVKNKPDAAIALGQSLLNELRTNKNINIKPEFQQRLDQYVEDADVSEADTMEEVMTLASEGLSNGTIEINETIGVKLGNYIRRALSAMGMKVKFKDGKDVLNFIKDYNRSIHRQKGLSRGLKKTAIEGAEVSITPETIAETEIKELVTKESKRKLTPEQDKQAQDKVKEIQELQKESEALAEKYNKPFIKGAKQQRLEKELFDADVKATVDSFVEDRTKALYDPIAASNKENVTREQFRESMKSDIKAMVVGEFEAKQPLEKFITSRGYLRANSLAKRLGIASVEEGITKSIDDTTKQIIGEETKAETVTADVAKKPTETTRFNEDLLTTEFKQNNDTSKEAIENKITKTITEAYEGRDVTGFKDLGSPKFPIPKPVAQLYADMFGIKTVEGLTKKAQNFYPRDRDGLRNLQKFLIENSLSDYNRLPKTISDIGKATGIKQTKLGKIMYNDKGVKVGTAKQYRDIMQGKNITLTVQNGTQKGQPIEFNKPVKDISRGDLQQNLKTAWDFHVKNRALETLVPEQGKRIQAGAKFSKRIEQSFPETKKSQIQNLGRPFSELKGPELAQYMDGLDAFIDAIAVDGYNVEAAFNEIYGADFLTSKKGDPLARKTELINEWTKVRQSGEGLKDFLKQTPSKITMRDYLYQAFEEQTESEVVENILGIKKGGVDFRSKDQIISYVNLMNNYIASKYGKLNDKKIAEFVINELGPTLSAGAKVAGNDFMWQLDKNSGLLRLVPSTLKRSGSIRTSVFGNQKQMSEVLIKPFLSEAGKNKLTYKDNTPLWEGKPLKKGQVSQKVNTYATSIKKNGGISEELLDKSADFAQQKIETIVDFLNWYKSQGSNKEITVDMLGMAFRGFNGDMTALVRAAARVDSFAGDGTGPQRYEHNPPARTMLVRMAEYVNGDITEQQLRDYFSNYTVSIIPETMDNIINERYKDTSPLVGSRYYNAFTYGRFPFAMTKYTKQEDGSYDKTVIGEYQKEAYKNANKIKKANNSVTPKALMSKRTTNQEVISDLGTLDNALNQARRPDAPVKKIRVFDFDDTLARSKSMVIVNENKPTTPQVIFLTGAAGSGKTTAAKNFREDFVVVDKDVELQALIKEAGLPSDMNNLTREQSWEFRELQSQASNNALEKIKELSKQGKNIVIDDTGSSEATVSMLKTQLGKQGYETKMVLLDVPLEKSLERNRNRKERILTDITVKNSFEALKGNKKRFKELFKNNFTTVEGGNFSSDLINSIVGTKTYKINATEFAARAADLEAQGATFDFTEFSKVVEGKKGPLFSVAQKIAEARGTEDIFILTARPQDAAGPIQEFMKANGINIPLANITGLGDGTAAAKGRWIAGKAAEGYNDFYFADDAIKNVKAVKDVLSQIDVKSKVQQAKASKRIVFDKVFNDIIEAKTGIESYKDFSAAKAKTVGASKGKFTFFTTPSAEDFLGLLYKTLGKGKVGDAQMAFYKTNLLDPYNRAEIAISQAKVAAGRDYKALKKQFKNIPKTLEKETGIAKYTYQHAIRTYIWNSQGLEVPGLSKRDQKRLTDFVKADTELQAFADQLVNIQKGKPYPKPDKDWTAGNITTDVISGINKVNRAEYLQEWQENVDIIFSEKNINKLEAAFGAKYVEALKDSLRAMKSGSNRPLGGDRVSNGILDWLNNSVGAIMFLNTRSAVLQTISAVNFVNWGDNNILKAGKAFANQKQFWGDFLTLMNSDYLLERRDGLKINVSESEIADAVEGSKNKVNAAISYLLNKGFVFTRYADSFAIASGGATFYRNRIESLVEQGMDRKAAEEQAFNDFRAIAEENQQSSSPSKISQQQRSLIGRIILQFGNTQLQYVRIQKRAVQDLVNKRGDWKSNISKIVYYGAMQNLLFNALQSGLAWALFDDDEDDEELTEKNKEQKFERTINGAIDSQLKGLGIQGAVIAGVKNALMTIAKEADKRSPKFEEALDDLLSIAPALGSKIRKLKSAGRTVSWNRKEIKEKGFSMDNPAYLAGAQVISAAFNIPLDRAVMKMNNMRNILNPATENWQKVALALGWSGWDVGLPYFGLAEDKPVLTETEKQTKKLFDLNKSDQVKMLLDLGLTKKEIRALTKEEQRVDKIIKLQNKKKDGKDKP